MTAQSLKIVQLIILQSDLSNLFHRSCTTDSGEENLHWIQQNPKFKVSTSDFWPITAHAGLWRLLVWNNMFCILIGGEHFGCFLLQSLVEELQSADPHWRRFEMTQHSSWCFKILPGSPLLGVFSSQREEGILNLRQSLWFEPSMRHPNAGGRIYYNAKSYPTFLGSYIINIYNSSSDLNSSSLEERGWEGCAINSGYFSGQDPRRAASLVYLSPRPDLPSPARIWEIPHPFSLTGNSIKVRGKQRRTLWSR